jgi:protein-tyrosine phosphatase
MPQLHAQVTDDLHVGQIEAVAQEPDTFDTIISVCQDAYKDNVSDDTAYCHYPLADDEQSMFNWGGRFDYETFHNAAWETVTRLASGHTVLVHCHHGKNRSVAVVSAAFGYYYGYSALDAYDFVRSARPQADSNDTMRTWASWFINGVKPEDVSGSEI